MFHEDGLGDVKHAIEWNFALDAQDLQVRHLAGSLVPHHLWVPATTALWVLPELKHGQGQLTCGIVDGVLKDLPAIVILVVRHIFEFR